MLPNTTRTKDYRYQQIITNRGKDTLSAETYSRRFQEEDKYIVRKKDIGNKCVCGKCGKGACNCICSRCEKCAYERFHEKTIYKEKSFTKKLVKWGEERKTSRIETDDNTLRLRAGSHTHTLGHYHDEDDLKRDETLVKYFMPNARKFNCKDKKSPLFTIEGIQANEERKCRWGGYKRKCFCGMCDLDQEEIKRHKTVTKGEKVRNKIEIKYFKPKHKKYRYSVERKCICGSCTCGQQCELALRSKKMEEDKLKREEERKRREEEFRHNYNFNGRICNNCFKVCHRYCMANSNRNCIIYNNTENCKFCGCNLNCHYRHDSKI